MSSNKKSNWEDWETLAYEYVKTLYKNAFVQEERHTSSSHDSGFDGLWLLRPQNTSLLRMILMEAKYRTSQSSLPLNDCAKAIIIAFNLSAKQLYIVTNIPFAPQTKENVIKFKKRSNLEITCVNGSELKTFIKNNKEYLIKKCNISKIFLSKLEESIKSHTEIEMLRDEQITSDYIRVPEREKQLTQIAKGLALQSSIYLISGKEGSGKSVLCSKIGEKLEEYQFDINIIDLNICTSSRILYLSVLESIWGVELAPILEDSDLIHYIDSLISVGDDSFDSGIANAVKYILLSSYHKYEEHKDIFLHLLLKYLDLILKPGKNELRIVIFFENLNMASEEVFLFLMDIIKSLKKNNIRVVLEARTPFLLYELEDIPKSKKYFQCLKKYIDIKFEIALFEHEYAIKLIKQHFNFRDSVCDSLANILCDNPLEIHNAIKLLECQISESDESINKVPLVELNDYWNELGITFSTTTISLINSLKALPYFSQIFELSLILKGHIPREILELFFGKNTNDVIQISKDSTIFAFCNNTLIYQHLRYLDAMEKVSDANIRYRTAKKLLPYIKCNENVDEFYQLVELNILYIIGNRTEIPMKTLQVVNSLMRMHQYQDALSELLRCIKTVEENKPSTFITDDTFIQILLLTLTCIRELHEENNTNYEFVYSLTEKTIILKNADLKKNKFWYEYQLMQWHKKFVIGNLKDALEISKELYISLKRTSCLFDDAQDYPGQVYNAYGLSIKISNSGEEAEKIFFEGKTLYPQSYYAQAALLSQEGNQLLKYNPSSAINKYQKLLETVKNKQYPYQEVLHTKIDIAMAFFLSGKFYESEIWSKESSEEASSINMLSQKGRAKNIYGCCLTAQKQYPKCIEVFEESITLLEMSKSIIYLWRAQLNLASVLFFQSEKIELAKQLLQNVLDTLQYTFASKIKEDKHSVPYHGLLLVLMYLYELEEYQTIDKVKSIFGGTPIIDDFSNLLGQKDWRNYFNNKVICYAGIVLVTG